MLGGDATTEVLESLARDVLDGNASMDDLMQLLEAWGRDEEVLSGFFRALGGRGTAELVELLSEQAAFTLVIGEDVVRRHAEVLLSAMSVASASWTPGQARRFTEQMTEYSGWPGAVGFLFCSAETAPMGENFTVAMADRIDTYVRVNGGATLATFARHDGVPVLANLLHPDRASLWFDPMSGVLETLGRYPETALNWLLDGAGKKTVPRIDYWVGQHDWRVDGFVGVASLWSALQQQPGGPLDVTGYDELTWKRLATANTAFAAGLYDNPGALPERLSVEAQVHLATALGRMMPLLSYCVYSDPTMGEGLYRDDSIFFADGGGVARYEKRVTPLLDREHIEQLFGLAGSSLAGREVLRMGVEHVQHGLIASTLTHGGPTIDSVLQRVASLQGILDGALVGSVEGIAGRAAERAGQLVDIAFGVIDLVPIPGSGIAAGQMSKVARDALGDYFAEMAENAVKKAGGVVSDRIVAEIRQSVGDAAAESALQGTWMGEFGGIANGEPGTRESLKDALRPWVDLLDTSQSSILREKDGDVELYLEVLTSNYDGDGKEAEGEAADG